MEDADVQVLEMLVIMFTVVTVGLVVIIGTFTVQHFICPPLLSVLAALWAWGLIAVKRLHFWGQQRRGRDQMFSLMEIHVYEISSSVMLLLVMLFCFYMRPNRNVLQGLPLEGTVQLWLAGLSITGYGMGLFFAGGPPVIYVFFPGDLGLLLIALGLFVVVLGERCFRRPRHAAAAQGQNADGFHLFVYVLVLLAATYIAGDWK